MRSKLPYFSGEQNGRYFTKKLLFELFHGLFQPTFTYLFGAPSCNSKKPIILNPSRRPQRKLNGLCRGSAAGGPNPVPPKNCRAVLNPSTATEVRSSGDLLHAWEMVIHVYDWYMIYLYIYMYIIYYVYIYIYLVFFLLLYICTHIVLYIYIYTLSITLKYCN